MQVEKLSCTKDARFQTMQGTRVTRYLSKRNHTLDRSSDEGYDRLLDSPPAELHLDLSAARVDQLERLVDSLVLHHVRQRDINVAQRFLSVNHVHA